MTPKLKGQEVFVTVETKTGRFGALFCSSGRVGVYRWKHKAWQSLGEGELVDGEILGMPGRNMIEERAYAALEGALEAWDDSEEE